MCVDRQCVCERRANRRWPSGRLSVSLQVLGAGVLRLTGWRRRAGWAMRVAVSAARGAHSYVQQLWPDMCACFLLLLLLLPQAWSLCWWIPTGETAAV